MGSVFVTQSDRTIRGFAGKQYEIPFYLQFVPGVVVEVVHSEESLRYGGPKTINTIIAKPHVTDKLYKRRATLGEKDRYYPLFRTMNDVPSKGDPILLCTIGKINYYLGPINTTTNSPTWNDDPSFVDEIQFDETKKSTSTDSRAIRGETQNFNKEILYSRMTKKRKKDLDYGEAIREATGDTIFEGRHGNSIRIGSRSNKPYLFFSNNRNPLNEVETILDGSLLTITSDGTINQHVGNNEDVNFKLASDVNEENTYPIGDIFTSVNQFSDNSPMYDYNGNQMLFHSDKITLNTKLDDIFISSKKDIHIGSSRYTTISSGNSMIVNTTDFNIGDPQVAEMQPMVLGDTLKEVLNDIVAIFSKLQVMTQLGPQNILPTTQPDIQAVTNKIESIVSSFHKIEEG